MSETGGISKKPIVAMLCLGDVSIGDGALPLSPLFGQPLMHHVIKMLESLGISRFFVGMESVPGALLAYRDAAAVSGLQIDFVRDPADLAERMGLETSILVLRADLLWDRASLERAIGQAGPIVATVDERAENACFERIDLNQRWAGLAIVEASTLRAITQLPDGWDMASALMRQAIQDGVPFWRVQGDAHIVPLRTASDMAKAETLLMPIGQSGLKNAENAILAPVVRALTVRAWKFDWGRNVAVWSFPALAIIALIFAMAQMEVTASIIAVVAVVASELRKSVRTFEYAAHLPDREAGASWIAMAAAWVAMLIAMESTLFEALFVGLALMGLMLAGAKDMGRAVIASPLVVALGLTLGAATGTASIVMRVLILAEIAALLAGNWRRADKR